MNKRPLLDHALTTLTTTLNNLPPPVRAVAWSLAKQAVLHYGCDQLSALLDLPEEWVGPVLDALWDAGWRWLLPACRLLPARRRAKVPPALPPPEGR